MDLKNYIPKGEIKGFPIEIVRKMLENQVLQGNEENVTIFERNNHATCNEGGFDWHKTNNPTLWSKVIPDRDFDLFFEHYPKNTYPKEMYVSMAPIENTVVPFKREVFGEYNGRYLVWLNAEQTLAACWKYAVDVKQLKKQEIVELTFEDISKGKGVGVDPKLIRIKK